MRGHHLWRDVSEINKPRESLRRGKRSGGLRWGVESEATGTNDREPPSDRGWLGIAVALARRNAIVHLAVTNDRHPIQRPLF